MHTSTSRFKWVDLITPVLVDVVIVIEICGGGPHSTTVNFHDITFTGVYSWTFIHWLCKRWLLTADQVKRIGFWKASVATLIHENALSLELVKGVVRIEMTSLVVLGGLWKNELFRSGQSRQGPLHSLRKERLVLAIISRRLLLLNDRRQIKREAREFLSCCCRYIFCHAFAIIGPCRFVIPSQLFIFVNWYEDIRSFW